MSTKSLLLSALCLVATFLQLNAQSTTEKSNPMQLVDDMHSAFGEHHARAVHTKGIILEGVFTPSLQAKGLTKAMHLQKEKSKVVLRFSDFAGLPDIPDNSPFANPRGLAIKFISPAGATTDIVGHSFNGFPSATSDDFHDLLTALAASGTQAEKPTPLDKYLAAHPVAKAFLSTQHNPASFGTISYFGVNSFQFTSSSGKSTFIRYQFIPAKGEKLITDAQMAASGKEYLMTEIKKRVASGPVIYKMYAQIAEKGDKIQDPSIAWPAIRKKILLGTITISKISSNTAQQDKALLFIPLNLPDGIKPADPMLSFRSRAYPISFGERQ